MPPAEGASTPDPAATDTARAVRVLWLVKGLGPGGAERLLVLQARVRDRAAIDVDVAYLLAYKNHLVGALRELGVPVRLLDAGAEWDLRWTKRLRHLLGEQRYDVIHVHSPYVAALTRLVVRTLRAPHRPAVVVTEHNRWPRHSPLTRMANRLTVRLDDADLAVSDDVRASMPAKVQARVEVLVHGIDLGEAREARTRRAEMRARLGFAADEVVIGIVANLRREKGYDTLLDAAAMLFRRRPEAPVRFVSVGQGPLTDEVAAQHARLGLGDRFVLLGYHDDPLAVLAACDVFTLTSRHEGLPIALMEALAVGLPVVATSVGGIAQAVDDGTEALLVAPDRPDDLASAYLRVVDDVELRHALASAAERRGAQFGIEPAQRRLEELYTELDRRRRANSS